MISEGTVLAFRKSARSGAAAGYAATVTRSRRRSCDVDGSPTNQTVFAFRSDSVIRIIRKLDAASELASALEKCLPAIVGLGDRSEAEQTALTALANWEQASR